MKTGEYMASFLEEYADGATDPKDGANPNGNGENTLVNVNDRTGEKTEYTLEELEAYVKQYTRSTSKLIKEVDDYTAGCTVTEHAEKRISAHAAPNAEEDATEKPIAPKSLTSGRWYKMLNYDATCYVFVHNLTRDVTAVRPENFGEPTMEELARERKKGIPLQMLEDELKRARYNKQQTVCLLGTEETCQNIRTFFKYRGFVFDCKPLTSVITLRSKEKLEAVLEEARKTIVNAAKQGQVCLIHMSTHIPNFNDKICSHLNLFPPEVFLFGKLKGPIMDRLFKQEDKEAGQCVVRDGFQIVLNLAFDGAFTLEMSSMQKSEVQDKIPGFDDFFHLCCRGW
eukprot:GEMP01032884.1.p1 GENE.GEMP01032884.1~~GEMP01032884.1.p1  ORF type:complete len:341 (+),score=95.09 GEMP01032884.1:133-1155(+)